MAEIVEAEVEELVKCKDISLAAAIKESKADTSKIIYCKEWKKGELAFHGFINQIGIALAFSELAEDDVYEHFNCKVREPILFFRQVNGSLIPNWQPTTAQKRQRVTIVVE